MREWAADAGDGFLAPPSGIGPAKGVAFGLAFGQAGHVGDGGPALRGGGSLAGGQRLSQIGQSAGLGA